MFLQVFINFVVLQSYIKIYQGEELPHPKSMLQVGIVDAKKHVAQKHVFILKKNKANKD